MITNNSATPENLEVSPNLKIDTLAIKKSSLIFRSINHKLRQTILKLLAEESRLTVTDIYIKLRIEQSVASQHLAILRKSGLVNTMRDGKNIFYTVSLPKIEFLQDFSEKLNAFLEEE